MLPSRKGHHGEMTSRNGRSHLSISLIILLVIGCGDAFALAIWYWSQGMSFDGTTSGVWTALAYDLAQGEMYRPLLSDIGYGGTRYVPLSFIGHGALIWLGLDPTFAGVLWMQLNVVIMVVIVAILIAQTGVSGWLAFGIASVTFCTTIYQNYVTEVNADYLATWLSLAALAGFVARVPLILVAFVATAAVFAKFTSLYVPAAILLSMLLRAEYRRATAFAVNGIGFLVLGTVFFQALSGGLMFENLSATFLGGAGATNSETSWHAMGFLKRFLAEILFYNPAIGVTFLMALFVAYRSRLAGSDPILLTFVFVTLATALTFASRGIAGNHVIALHAVSLVVIGRGAPKLPRFTAIGFGILTVILVATWLPTVPSPRKTLVAHANPSVSELRDAVEELRTEHGPIFALHPAYPPILGERAFLLDGFNLANFIVEGSPAASDFFARIDSKSFSVVIVEPGHAFAEAFRSHYEEVGQLGRNIVMVPRP